MIVKHTLDPKNPPKMGKAERARFGAIRDEDIDYSDIPELDADFWATAKIEKPAQKPSVTIIRVWVTRRSLLTSRVVTPKVTRAEWRRF